MFLNFSKSNKNSVFYLLLFFAVLISCKVKKVPELEIGKIHTEKIQIYVRKDTLKFGDEKFKNDITISYLKIDLNKNTISFAHEQQMVGDVKVVTDVRKLFEKSDSKYVVITKSNSFETLKIVSKNNRKWNDFATPSRSVKPAEKFVTEGNTIRFKKSNSLKRFVFDSELTTKANEN